MDREVGDKDFPIWLLGDSNPTNWQDILITPLDPRHPARHNIWTPVLEVIQDRVFRAEKRRIDSSKLYIRNAIEDPSRKPEKNTLNWNQELQLEVSDLANLLNKHKPIFLLCFGAFSYEFCRRSQNLQPQSYDVWGARSMGDNFRSVINDFSLKSINILPLLHVSISRGRFIESHNYFSDDIGGNYFEHTGNLLSDKFIEHKDELDIWLS